jgi:hypothetical protein
MSASSICCGTRSPPTGCLRPISRPGSTAHSEAMIETIPGSCCLCRFGIHRSRTTGLVGGGGENGPSRTPPFSDRL